jgi:hypothetical protein
MISSLNFAARLCLISNELSSWIAFGRSMMQLPAFPRLP